MTLIISVFNYITGITINYMDDIIIIINKKHDIIVLVHAIMKIILM